ncbi:hypothetical protein J4Q44_G00180070 [Coregonus suidteri]|uniref:E3 ubiquitin-protein ligase RNF213-like n=1 Tax=Coregonus suidteri TaxID=861788 RepID=A0AAN8LGP8_9TELE
MKCTGCGRVGFEKTARYCSQCGHQLSTQSLTNETDNTSGSSPKLLQPSLESMTEKTETQSDGSSLNNREKNTSPKRPNEEPNSNPKKKRKKRKRTKKKKDGPASLDSDQVTSDLSDISLMDSQGKNRKQEVAESSDSDSDASAMDETPNSLHDTSASVEKPASASATSAAPSTISPTGNTSDNQGPPSTASSQPEAGAESQPAAGKDKQSSEENDVSQSPSKQTSESAPNDTPASLTTTIPPLQSASAVVVKTADQKAPKAADAKTADQKAPKAADAKTADQKAPKAADAKTADQKAPKAADAKTADQKAPKAADAKTADQKAPKAADAKTADQKAPKAADAKTADQKAPKAADAKTADQKAPKAADAKTADQKAPKAAEAKSTKNKKDMANSKQTNLDQNANQNAKQNQTRQDKQEGKDGQQNHDSKPPTTVNKDMVFGSQKKSEVESRGSSVDPQVKVENMEVQQQPAHGGGDASTTTSSSSPTPQSPGVNKEKRKDNKSDDSETKGQDVPPPKRIPPGNKQVSASERLTIYFHAVLSKDFKLNPDEDRIFIRAGANIGTWKTNSVELTVSRDLGDHGFLVQGSLITSKSNATVSIPYKYLVYKHKKQKYEYEYIYKLDSTHPTTNRCLFVKSHLLNEEGDWHQYDDIICVEPSKNVLKRLKDAFWPDQRKSVIEGREIAGKVMLESIFDLLRSWTDINFKSFLNQLNQFYQIYGNPFVYEETHKKWFSLDYDEKDVRKLLKQFMLDNVVPQLQKEGEGKSCFIQDPMRAAVVMLYVWKQFSLKLDHGESTRLCTALCLPKLPKDSFLQYWTDFSQAVSGLKNLPDMLVALINSVKTEGPRWILVLPLLHLLKGSSKPFAPISTTVTPKYELSWAGLQGLKAGNMTLNSQDRRAMLNLMKNNGHLVEMDRLVSRSWMCLLPIEDLMECSVLINVELLDLLHVFTLRAPQDVTYSNNQYVSDTLSYIQSNLIEEKYSCFSEAYGRECLATAVKLLEKICRGVRSTSTYTQNFTDIPVACMNMVVSVSEFARTFESQATKDVVREHMHAKELELLSEAMVIVRSWIGQTFRDRLLGRGVSTLYLSVHVTTEIEMWNNIISLKFANDDFTKEWRQTFTRDLEGKLKRESPLDQIEIYCSQMEVLNESHPHVARSIEKCALEAVTSLCQSKSEGKLFDRFRINWKFGKLISAIIQKSWPRNERGDYHEEDEVVFQHLLSWTAAKNIFQLHVADEKLIDQLSEEARERMTVAISSFTAISNQLVHGNIRIKLLNSVLEKRDTFTELLKIDCLSENERYKDSAPMKRLLLCRQEEVKAVYHEKELVEVLLTMSRKLQEHVIVDFEGLEERLQTNIEAMTLDQFMEVHPFDQLLLSDGRCGHLLRTR